jgi:protein SCO1/2
MAADIPVFSRSRSPSTWPQVALIGGMVVAAAILLFAVVRPVKVMPYLAQAPVYTVIDQHGQPFSSGDLENHVVVYDFIYTHCTTVCPAMTGQMLQIQRALDEAGWLGDEVMLVTVTFDPERDTPQRLLDYATQINANPEAWVWLTGEPVAVKQLVGSEFGVYFERVPVDEAEARAAGLTPEQIESAYDFIHSTSFVVVDGQGRIRAEYQQMLDVDQALRDIGLVVREANAGWARPLWQAAHLLRAYP